MAALRAGLPVKRRREGGGALLSRSRQCPTSTRFRRQTYEQTEEHRHHVNSRLRGGGLIRRSFHFFHLLAGVSQSGVLSAILFVIFIDSVVDKVKSTDYRCYFFSVCVSIFLYADDDDDDDGDKRCVSNKNRPF